jgi:signal transduction histidine kinase
VALEHYKSFSATNDSLFSQDRKNEMAGLDAKYNIALKDDEIALNKLTLSNQRRTQIGLIAGLLLFGVIGGLLYRQSRNRKNTNKTLMVLNNQLDEANKVKAKFFGILSHDLRSPVANLIHFLHLQKNDPDLLSEGDQATHQQMISQSAEDLLNTMESMLLWSKEQMDDFKPNIKNVVVSDLFAYLQNFFPHTGPVQLQFNHEPGLVVSTDENYLQIILQNLTSNALKAVKNTPQARIEWHARKEGDSTILSITDNGPGMSAEQVKVLYEDSVSMNARSGFGLHLIRDLAKAIRYQITIRSQPGMGTTFTLITAAR